MEPLKPPAAEDITLPVVPENPPQPLRSLVRTTMLQMALRISVIVVIASGIAYHELMQRLETSAREQLNLFIEQRVDIESQWLEFLGHRITQLRTEYIERYQRLQGTEPSGSFERYFSMNDDGTAYVRREFYEGIEGPAGVLYQGYSGGIDNDFPLTPDRRLRLVLAMEMLLQHGQGFAQPAVGSTRPLLPFVDFYIETPEKDLLVYWPGTPWYPDFKGGYDIATQGDFSRIFDQNIPFAQRDHSWTGTYRDEVPKVWMVSYTVPIDLNGKSIAGLGVDISLREINRRLTEYQLPGTSSLIMRGDGRLIAHPLQEKAMIEKKGNYYLQHDGDESLRALAALIAANPGKTLIDDVEHNRLLAVGHIAGPGWLFVTEYPKSLMSTAASKTVLFIFLTGVLALLLELAMLWRVLRRQVSQPLALFVRAAQAIGAGDLSGAGLLPVNRADELGVLAKTFHGMTRSLRATKAHLLADIAHREQVEKELVSRTERLNEAQRIARMGSWEQDLLTNELQWSDEIFRILEVDMATATPSYDLLRYCVYPDDLELVNKVYLGVLESHLSYEFQHRLLMTDGRVKWVQQRGETLYNSSGMPQVISGTLQDITAQKMLDDELYRHRHYLEQLVHERTRELNTYAAMQNAFLDNASALVVVVDAQRRIYRFNRASELLSGYTFSELQGREFPPPFLLKEEVERISAEMADLLGSRPNEMAQTFQNQWCCKNGDLRLLEWKVSLIRDAENTVEYVVSVGMDITERQRAEAAIIHSKNRLDEAQRIASVGSWELDIVSNALIWSDEVFRLFEVDKASFIVSYDAFLAAIHPEDRDAVNLAYVKSLGSRVPYEITHRLLMPDGRIKWVHERCETRYDHEGKALVSTGTVQDITVQKTLDEQLENYRVHLEQLVDERTHALQAARFAREELAVTVEKLKEAQRVAKVGSWEFDIGSGRLYWSDEMYHLHGLDKRQGPPDKEANLRLYDDYSMQQLREAMERILTQGLRFEMELSLRVDEGQPAVWLYSICNMVLDSEGRFLGLSGTVQDITVKKRLTDDLEGHRLYLEDLVRERTKELEDAKNQAEQANQAKSHFLSNMSHELRTPMNAILGFGQLLQMSPTMDAEQQEYIHEILRGGYHLLDLINEVLDLAKIESGKLDLSMQPVCLAVLVNELFSMVKSLATPKSIQLTGAAMDDIYVCADHTRLRQVLLNLLSNAIKYNSEYGTVAIELHKAARENHIRIAVIDSGWGIADENVVQIFEPFYRLNVEHNKVEGTGIGLAITKSLVELMGGEMGVISRIGIGSCFWVELPVADAIGKNSTNQLHAAEPPYSNSGSRKKVLYIEDNPANMKLMQRIMEIQADIELICASESLSGLDLLNEHQPQLILLDINMAHIDGYKLLEIIRQDEQLKDVPVIAITANAMSQEAERARQSGFSEYLTKPLDVQRFLQILKRYLDA